MNRPDGTARVCFPSAALLCAVWLSADALQAQTPRGPAGKPRPAAVEPGAYLDVCAAYGAKGDGTTDDTRAIQGALDHLSSVGGGVAFLRSGEFLINTHLSIPGNTTLAGVWRIPPTWPQTHEANRGTTLLAIEGAGREDGDAFITLAGRNATLDGVQIFYPKQTRTNPPVAYPWTIRKGHEADGVGVQNVTLVNAWQGIDLGSQVGGRHLIRGVYGQPLKTGIFVDQCYDVGRIMDVHFWNFWAMDNEDVKQFMREHATAFRFQRTDAEVVRDIFAWEYAVGIEFSRSQHGAPYGQFSDVTLDAIASIGIDVQAADQQGLQFSNLSLIGRKQGVRLREMGGPLTISNAIVRGTTEPIVVEGGVLQLANSRIFPDFDPAYRGARTMIEIGKGRAIINGNIFQDQQGTAVEVGDGADRVIITGNELAGNRLKVGRAYRVVVANNTDEK